jgi:hypothetical protein
MSTYLIRNAKIVNEGVVFEWLLIRLVYCLYLFNLIILDFKLYGLVIGSH